MGNVVGSRDDYSRWKPKKYRHFLTRQEVATLVDRDRKRLTQLESVGTIPAPIRVKVGRHQVRLYSPAEVKKIVDYFKANTPGRPSKRKRR